MHQRARSKMAGDKGELSWLMRTTYISNDMTAPTPVSILHSTRSSPVLSPFPQTVTHSTDSSSTPHFQPSVEPS